MHKNSQRYKAYLSILKEELVPAMGCTEPIAIAYAAAKARDVLGAEPDKIRVEVSNNIVKNVKSVVVPNTGELKGLEASAAAGAIAGKKPTGYWRYWLEWMKPAGRESVTSWPAIKSKSSSRNSDLVFDLIVTLFAGRSQASVRISHFHTNIVLITKGQRCHPRKPAL